MEQWLNSIPKPIIVIVFFFLAGILVFFNEPPKDYCSNQLQVFKSQLAGVAFPGKAKVIARPPKLLAEIEQCKASNSIGGCYAMFSSLRQILQVYGDIKPECQDFVLTEAGIITVFRQAMGLLVTLAWGEDPPGMGPERLGWLENSELFVFCKMKEKVQNTMEEEDWSAEQSRILSGLPNISSVPKDEAFRRSLLSAPCGAFR